MVIKRVQTATIKEMRNRTSYCWQMFGGTQKLLETNAYVYWITNGCTTEKCALACCLWAAVANKDIGLLSYIIGPKWKGTWVESIIQSGHSFKWQ